MPTQTNREDGSHIVDILAAPQVVQIENGSSTIEGQENYLRDMGPEEGAANEDEVGEQDC